MCEGLYQYMFDCINIRVTDCINICVTDCINICVTYCISICMAVCFQEEKYEELLAAMQSEDRVWTHRGPANKRWVDASGGGPWESQ